MKYVYLFLMIILIFSISGCTLSDKIKQKLDIPKHPPFEEFCREKGMSAKIGYINDFYCLDKNGEKHFFTRKYENGKWTIGSKVYN